MNKKKRKVISLFSGAGGMDIGFEEAGFDITVAVESDSSCCNTLRTNRPNLPVIEKDICMVTSSEILDTAKLKPLEAALVIGGPPCQSFSLAGKRMGLNDKRGMLVLEFARIVRDTLPCAFVMENVKGMANWEKGKAIEAIKDEFLQPIYFDGCNYQYEITYGVLNASGFGVPQHRERLFLVGNRLGKRFNFPDYTHGMVDDVEPKLFVNHLKPFATTWDAIGNLPPCDEPSETAKRVSQTIKGRRAKHGY